MPNTNNDEPDGPPDLFIRTTDPALVELKMWGPESRNLVQAIIAVTRGEAFIVSKLGVLYEEKHAEPAGGQY